MPALQPAAIISSPETPTLEIREPLGAVAHLASLHREAEETARLANLLGRSLHLAIALPVLATATLAATGTGLAEGATWAVLVLAASAAIFVSYRQTMRQPFERAALNSFSKDLDAIMVFSGFAWGGGSFLALSAATGISGVVLFTAGAGAAVAVLLRERHCMFLFLAPVTALTAFACFLRPLDAGALGAAFVLIAAGAISALAFLAERRSARGTPIPLTGLPTA